MIKYFVSIVITTFKSNFQLCSIINVFVKNGNTISILSSNVIGITGISLSSNHTYKYSEQKCKFYVFHNYLFAYSDIIFY